jgi:hypothetical protein
MAWERRGNRTYYFRRHSVAGRKLREYIGTGPIADAAAAADAIRQADRQAVAAARRAQAVIWGNAEASVHEATQAADHLTKACLAAAGYHQHDRAWRLRHVLRSYDRDYRNADR